MVIVVVVQLIELEVNVYVRPPLNEQYYQKHLAPSSFPYHPHPHLMIDLYKGVKQISLFEE